LDQVKGVLLFGCFTGLVYQEVYNLTENEIVIGKHQNKCNAAIIQQTTSLGALVKNEKNFQG
jgi:hypothetical protein